MTSSPTPLSTPSATVTAAKILERFPSFFGETIGDLNVVVGAVSSPGDG